MNSSHLAHFKGNSFCLGPKNSLYVANGHAQYDKCISVLLYFGLVEILDTPLLNTEIIRYHNLLKINAYRYFE